MSVVSDLLKNVKIPDMVKVRQEFPADEVTDVVAKTRAELEQAKIKSLIKPGMSIAIGAGSRGISNYAKIILTVVEFIKECGASPFIVAAMGSHGGASAQGQTDILTGYGITEAAMGCPLKIAMDTVIIGETEEGHPVHIDAHAAAADGIIVVNRIKPHTAFRGDWESGLMKMLSIGIAKQKGAEFCHAKGFKHMAHMVPLFGKAIIKHSSLLFGVALLENAYDHTADIIALTGSEIITEEPKLLLRAKAYMPRLLIDECDVLLVDEIGKNISGDGMDPNISGTFATPYADGGVTAQRVAVLDITEESHGNGVGWGMADCSTQRAFDKFDGEMSYPNSLTCLVTQVIKVPMILKNDKECIQASIKTLADVDFDQIRIIRIKNTLSLSEIEVSTPLMKKAEETNGMRVISAPAPLPFDQQGNLF